MLTLVTWLWQKKGYRSFFTGQHVNVLADSARRNYRGQLDVVCVTDVPVGIDPSVRIVPAWNDFKDVQSPHGAHQPSCYRRLRAFHPDIGSVFGERFVMLDLDTVIVGDVTKLWNRPEDFVSWGETDPRSFYNGSMMLMRAGARAKVWTEFDQAKSPAISREAGRFGSDQGWISHILGPGEARWGTKDGVYSFRVHLKPAKYVLPSNAKIVMFHGGTDPWSEFAQMLPWVREHWRIDRPQVEVAS
jgi:hypothetical protein